MSKIYHYFVEGECEQKLLNTYRVNTKEPFNKYSNFESLKIIKTK